MLTFYRFTTDDGRPALLEYSPRGTVALLLSPSDAHVFTSGPGGSAREFDTFQVVGADADETAWGRVVLAEQERRYGVKLTTSGPEFVS